MRKEFIPFISSVQGWPNYPSIIELENLLSNLEAIHKQAANNNNSTSQVEDVLYTKNQGKKNYSSKQPSGDQFRTEGQSKGKSKGCYRCGKQGHNKQDCWVKVVCNRCGKSGHIKANCRVKLDEAGANVANESKESEQSNWEQCLSIEVIDQPTSMTSVVHQTNAPIDVNAAIDYNKEWIVDSGCSHHTMGNATLLSDVCPYCRKRLIVTADNLLHPVLKEGHFEKGNSNDRGIFLKEVYHVPGLKKNLTSVSQITTSERYVLFGPNDAQILFNVKHIAANVLFTGKRKESLYVLSASDAYVGKTTHNASATLWHARLGHVGYQLLQMISTKKLLDGVLVFKEIHHDVICLSC